MSGNVVDNNSKCENTKEQKLMEQKANEQKLVNDKTKEIELLRNISNIDEKFIAEAAEPETIYIDSKSGIGSKAGAGSINGASSGSYKRSRRGWKIAGTIAACFVIVVVSGTVLFSSNMFRMGSAKSSDAGDMMVANEGADMAYESADMAYEGADIAYQSEDMNLEGAKYKDVDGGLAAAPTSNEPQVYNGEVKKAETKLIYTADVYIQTTKYDEEVQKIKALVEKFGGYFESSNTYNGGYYETEVYKNGYFIARIPQEKYRDFLSGIENNSHITNLTENVQDVGEYYFDLESKLKMYRTKEERLQELLKKATSLSDIIELESALTEVQSQINMYKSDINHYDSLIGYSTINISIDQVAHVGSGYDQDNGFFARLSRNFINGLRGFVQGIENFVMWIARNIVTIVIIAAVIILARKFHIIKWIKEHIKR